MTTFPDASLIQIATVPLQGFLTREAAILAAKGSANPLPEIDFTLATVKIGDGNAGAGAQIPPIATLQNSGALVHQVWSGNVVQSVSVNATNPNQVDILCVIPAVDNAGNEIGPFWCTEFIITDENGTPMIAGVTLAPKFVTANGASTDLAFIASVGFSIGAVVLGAPSAAFLTGAQAVAMINSALPDCVEPIEKTDAAQPTGLIRRIFSFRKATKPADATLASDANAIGSGRPATDAEFNAGAPVAGGFLWPWPTLQQIAGALASLANAVEAWVTAQLTHFLPLAGGVMTGPIVLAANPLAALQASPKQYVDAGDAAALAAAEAFATNLVNGFLTGTPAPGNTGYLEINDGPLTGFKLQWCRNLVTMANGSGDATLMFTFPIAFSTVVYGYAYCGDDEITSQVGGGCTALAPSLTSQAINIHSSHNSAVLVAVSGFVIGK
jgi:hypothetical protein